MSKKHKTISRSLNYIKCLLILASVVSWCVSIYALKICLIIARIKKYNSIIKKNTKEAWQNSIVSKKEVKYHKSINF